MPTPEILGEFGKLMFEKRMREKNMGTGSFEKIIESRPPTVVFPERGNFMNQKERIDEIMKLRTEGQPFNNRFKDAIKGFSGIGSGFDNSALMQDPKFRQMDTMNQGIEVSEPYFEANKQAFSKNNPMNAISQETPVGDKVSAFLKLMGR